jgi:hypothetical protein
MVWYSWGLLVIGLPAIPNVQMVGYHKTPYADTSSAKWQADQWPDSFSSNGGSSC